VSLNNFIPTVWAARVLLNLHKAQVWGQPAIVNMDYEGDITGIGNVVRINAIGPVSVRKYQKDVLIGYPDVLSDSATTLTVDQGDLFNFAIDDLDKLQQKPKVMDAALWEAAYAISNAADIFISGIVAGVSTANTIGTDAAPQTDLAPASGLSRAYDYLVDLAVLLSASNVPTGQRWVTVPPWFHGLMRRDDRFVRYGTTAQEDILQNGIVGRAAGFDVYETNNILLTGASTNVYNITAGYPGAITYADQMSEMQAYRPEQRFADAVKGLHIYGAKLARPQGIAVLKAQNPGF
jgi:hypothetical protein